MKTTKRHLFYYTAGTMLLALASCVGDDLHDTPHPDRGVVAVVINLPEGTATDDFTVEIEGTPMEKAANGYTVTEPLVPGEYNILAHNTPRGFTIADGIARVNAANNTRALYPQQPGMPLIFTATIDGQNYVNSASIQPALDKGKSYSYTITVRKTGLTVSGCTIEPWSDGGSNPGDATMQ